MTHLELSSITISTAPMGRDNPLPPLRELHYFQPSVADAEISRGLTYGLATSLLPYTLLDGYGRERADTPLRTAVLSNGILRAEFLLDYGGRMWSLRHLPTGRELLHTGSVLQPANLGLRNAWFAGGVEWNIGTLGHSPLSCVPVHAARVERPDGTPVLRMYEFERMRGIVFQVDAYLPSGSPVLFTHVRLRNPGEAEVPVYWWTNLAVPETPGTRVLVPATEAYQMSSDNMLRRVTVPEHDGVDETYPGRGAYPADFFYDVPDGTRGWTAALGEDGTGVIHTATGRLRGRKLFRWGTSVGGRNWQDWLSGPGAAYLEIQAGLTRTQLEHVPLASGASWSWVEGFGLATADPAEVHSADWTGARAAAARAIEELVPERVLESELAGAGEWADAAPVETLHKGSGWGALERLLRGLDLPGTPFPEDTIGRDQNSWRALVRTGTMPTPSPDLPPSSYTVGPRWRELLEKSEVTWFTQLHLGVNRYHAGDKEGAREAWRRSLACDVNAWALRNLAVADAAEGNLAAAAEGMIRAHRLVPRLRPLTIETLKVLVGADRPGEALAVVDRLDHADRWHGRIRLLECQAAVDVGDLRRAGRLLDSGIVVDDLHEGEDALDTLWWAYHERRAAADLGIVNDPARVRIRRDHPLPCLYDYRMD